MSQSSAKEFSIGLFDSGVGGLSVLRQLEKVAARASAYDTYRFLYLGDTARCPYGNREPADIAQFVGQIGTWLLSQGAGAIVMACNTSAALAGAKARETFCVPVYDLITPTAEHAASLGVKTAVLATASTAKSHAFSRAINACNDKVEVTEVGCPDLVPIVESGQIDDPHTLDVLWKYVRELRADKVKAVILGCTHYPFLREQIHELLPEVLIIDPAEQLARALICQSGSMFGDVASQPTTSVRKELFTTGPVETFAATAEACLKEKVGTVSGISVEQLVSALPAITIAPAVPGSTFIKAH